jgi:hypothetical protein
MKNMPAGSCIGNKIPENGIPGYQERLKDKKIIPVLHFTVILCGYGG